jgi:hypothetical protein
MPDEVQVVGSDEEEVVGMDESEVVFVVLLVDSEPEGC